MRPLKAFARRREQPVSRFKDPAALAAYREKLKQQYDSQKTRIRICMTGCRAYGAEPLHQALKDEIKSRRLSKQVEVVETGCHGFCARAPVAAIDPYGYFYQRITVDDVPEIIAKTVKKGEPVDKLTFYDKATKSRQARINDIPFFREQMKIVLRNCGQIDPTKIDQYIIREGYAALQKALTKMTPEQVIDEVKTAGLRGRGGAGFPAGLKWELARKVKGQPKYMVCNADEGDPGAFMDRGILEGDPHAIIEGLLIGAYAVGASTGYVYVRAEYPYAVKNLSIAVAQAQELGLLGENILGSGFDFNITVKEGAGAFVCGEETAMFASIEGQRGMPRLRPPFPAESGLFGQPTNNNNVETYANVAPIILNGAKWYSGIGTEKSKGTKVFSLAGKINNTGLVEVPMGVTLRHLIFDIGGGIPGKAEFKAVQMGGPSGGCVPAEHLDLPIDYDSLQSVGAIMGSGGVIVMDDKTCMVDLARFFVNFLQNESCGKCVPCRLGFRRMLEILQRIIDRQATMSDLKLLRELANVVRQASLCGLGQTGANPVLSTMRYFEQEYIRHIKVGDCNCQRS